MKNKKYFEANKEKMKEKMKNNTAENREAKAEYRKKYFEANKEKIKEKMKNNVEATKEMYKTVEPTNDVCIKFTDEELVELGWEPKQKFSVHLTEDGGVMLKKFETLELDLADWPMELIHNMIKESCDEDISINEVISRRLKIALDGFNCEEYEIKENK